MGDMSVTGRVPGLADVVFNVCKRTIEAAGAATGATLEIAGRAIESAGKHIGEINRPKNNGGNEWRA